MAQARLEPRTLNFLITQGRMTRVYATATEFPNLHTPPHLEIQLRRLFSMFEKHYSIWTNSLNSKCFRCWENTFVDDMH